jgi:uncharacterized damage-inducible protein DinB
MTLSLSCAKPDMDAAERASLLGRLLASRDTFTTSLAQVSEAQARFTPSPERWSIAQIAEHVAVAEHGMYRLITAHFQALDQPRFGRENEILEGFGMDRTTPWVAPERVRPKNRYASLSEAVQQFASNRDRTIGFVRDCQDDLRARVVNHAFGEITGQECLAFLIVHPLRHLDQIRELQQNPGYPE